MGKGKKKKLPGKKVIALVPASQDMDDETFLLHLEKRHRHETGVEKHMHRHALDAWVPSYRAWHERQHEIEADDYDHDHDVSMDWDEEND